MSAISSWLLSIAGAVILSVLAEFVLPEGQINKYTKVVFSFLTLLVVILPLPSVVGKEFDLTKFFNSSSFVQEDYLYQLNIDKLAAINDDISKEFEKNNLQDVKVSINANVLCENLEIFGVFVDFCDYEYIKNLRSNDISKLKQKIVDILKKFPLLENVEVSFSEQN